MANINVTYNEMADSATRMRNNKNDIDSRLNECKSIVQTLTNSGFVTEKASGRFNETSEQFVKSATQLMETLNELSSWLDKSVDAMRDMDSQLAGTLNK